jgi:hypothetical protein
VSSNTKTRSAIGIAGFLLSYEPSCGSMECHRKKGIFDGI